MRRRPRNIGCRKPLSFFPHLVKKPERFILGHLALSGQIEYRRYLPEHYLSTHGLHCYSLSVSYGELLPNLLRYRGLPSPRNNDLLCQDGTFFCLLLFNNFYHSRSPIPEPCSLRPQYYVPVAWRARRSSACLHVLGIQ